MSKTSNYTTLRSVAVIRGWVEPQFSSSEPLGPLEYVNADVVDLATGDVVVVQDDGTIIRTTTANDPRPTGVVVDAILMGEGGAVRFSGPVDLINVTGAVTAGQFAETSTTLGQADAVTDRSGTSFGFFTSAGTSPSGFLFGGGGAGTSSLVGEFLTAQYGEQAGYVDLGNVSGTVDIDCSLANVFDLTLIGNIVITISNPPATGYASTIALILRQDGTGSRTVTWPGTVDWQDTDGTSGGAAPTLFTAATAQDVIELETNDGGTTWGGSRLTGTNFSLTVQDEGTPLATSATTLNFVGAGVTATGTGATKTITIPSLTAADITALGFLSGPTFTVIGQEQRTSDGSTTAWTLDNDFEEYSVSARNLTTGHVLSVTETLPNTATISAAGTAGDIIAFAYAASVI